MVTKPVYSLPLTTLGTQTTKELHDAEMARVIDVLWSATLSGSTQQAQAARDEAVAAAAAATAAANTVVQVAPYAGSFVGNGSTATFTIPGALSLKEQVTLHIASVFQSPALYEVAISGPNTVVTFNQPFPDGAVVDWEAQRTKEVGVLNGSDALFSFGSAGTPGIRFATDTDTGIYRSAANTIGFSTGGTARALMSTTAFQIDVPITGETLTSGPLDNTSGKIPKFHPTQGIFGLGAIATPLVTDFFELLRPGFYRFQEATVSNGPTGWGAAYNATAVVLKAGDTTFEGATILAARGTSSPTARRFAIGNQNNARDTIDWAELYHNKNLVGTVSQSAGVPTGAVVQRGSNANGEFVRFADGTQICWHSVSIASLAISTGFMGGFRSAGQDWTFPAAFSANPSMNAYATGASAFGMAAHGAGTGVTGVYSFTAVTSQTAATRTATLMAIGRWF
jgi:hypothetical protein